MVVLMITFRTRARRCNEDTRTVLDVVVTVVVSFTAGVLNFHMAMPMVKATKRVLKEQRERKAEDSQGPYFV